MIRYGFQPHMIPGIRSGLVCQTFRRPAPRHATVGERIRLAENWSAEPIIPDPVCLSVHRCDIVWDSAKGDRIAEIREAGTLIIHREKFARETGYGSFSDFEDDYDMWLSHRPTEGVIIRWTPPIPIELEAAA